MESICGSVCCSICYKAFCPSTRNIAVDDDVLNLLKFLFKKINCSVLRNTQICKNCLENVQDVCNFKMYVEKKTLSIALKMEQIDPEVSCICQVCKEIIKKSSSVPITKVLKQVDYLIEEMPLGVEVTENSHICTSCQESIVNFHCVFKLLSKFVENNEHKCNIKIHVNPLTDTNKIEIKEEPVMEYENIANEHSMVKIEPLQIKSIKLDIKTESIHSDDVNLIYEDFITKNEEMDIKSESEESNSTEQMGKVIREHHKIIPWNMSSKHFTVDHKSNKKTSRTIKINNIPKFACDVCDYKAKQRGNLNCHMLIHKSIDEIKMFTCDICGHKIKYKSSLRRHMLQHQSVDETEMCTCDICGHKTKYKSDLRRHMLQHESVDEIEMFTCDICGHKTKYKSALTRHMLQHENVDEIKMFTCDVCDYRAKQKGNLKCHMLIHRTIEKIEMFKCAICGHKTKYKFSLKRHMLQHQNVDEIETFTCDICDHKTKYKSALRRHMLQHKSVHEIEIFTCDICGLKTKYKSALRRHIVDLCGGDL